MSLLFILMAYSEIEFYSIQIEENNANFKAYRKRGICRMTIGIIVKSISLLEEAIADFDIAIQLYEQYVGGQYTEAVNDKERALQEIIIMKAISNA